MTSAGSGLNISDLRFSYETQHLFSHWSAHLRPGLNWIHGDESCGKSTLLQLMSGKLAAQAGDLSLQGTSLHEDAKLYSAQVFLTEPRSEAFDAMTPDEYFIAQQAKYPTFDWPMLQALQEALDLTPHVGKKLFMLSNGSKRKVWLAAAFASGAALTLIDDPFAALDRPSIQVIRELLEDAASQTRRVFVVADYEVPAGLTPTFVIKLIPALAGG